MLTTSFRLIAKTAVKTPDPLVRRQCGPLAQSLVRPPVPPPTESPIFLVIEEKPERVFLFRFDASGHCFGDSWHLTIDGARQQAIAEFNDLLLDWEPLPAEVEDPISFGLGRCG